MLTSGSGIIDKKVLYAETVYDEREIEAVVKSLRENRWLASGEIVQQFEKKIAGLFSKKYAVATNSGSSANLLALAALDLPKGSKVITPALTFATTVSVIFQNNLVPVFVDGVVGRYTIDESLIESAIDENTSAIMVPQLIGGVCNMVELRKLADKYRLKIIDDSCDTLAPTLHNKPVSSYADLTTTSFYGSHIITAMGFGGMVMTDDVEIRDTLLNLRDWGRIGNDKEDFKERFHYEIDGIPYDSKFLYTRLGYNTKLTEAAAAFGLVQLEKLPEFLKIRGEAFAKLKEFFELHSNFFYLPELIEGATTNWLAFPLTIKQDAGFTRLQFLEYLENRGVQTRVLFSGNVTRHPVMRTLDFSIHGNLDQADLIMGNGLLVGAHQGMTDEKTQYLIDVCEEFLHGRN